MSKGLCGLCLKPCVTLLSSDQGEPSIQWGGGLRWANGAGYLCSWLEWAGQAVDHPLPQQYSEDAHATHGQSLFHRRCLAAVSPSLFSLLSPDFFFLLALLDFCIFFAFLQQLFSTISLFSVCVWDQIFIFFFHVNYSFFLYLFISFRGSLVPQQRRGGVTEFAPPETRPTPANRRDMMGAERIRKTWLWPIPVATCLLYLPQEPLLSAGRAAQRTLPPPQTVASVTQVPTSVSIVSDTDTEI